MVQDLEDKVSGQALETVEAALAAAQSQVTQLQSQLHQAQAKAAGMSHAEAHVTQLGQQLQQQQAASEAQATAVAELSVGFDRERASWQEERSSLLSRAKVSKTCSWFLLDMHKHDKPEALLNNNSCLAPPGFTSQVRNFTMTRQAPIDAKHCHLSTFLPKP